jgi:hypothetical protein
VKDQSRPLNEPSICGVGSTVNARNVMRPAVASILLLSLGIPASAGAETATPGLPTPSAQLKSERDNIAWAELEAQRRALDGDYEGAVQAEQQAGINRRAVAQSELLARGGSPKR